MMLLALACALVPAMARAESRQAAVAVLDLRVEDVPGFGRQQVEKFTELLDSVVGTAGMHTVPRSEIRERLLQEQAESYRACYDDACQIELGKAVAAEKVVSARWARFDRTCAFTLKIYVLRTSLAEFSTKVDASCDESGLRAAIEDVGRTLRARDQQRYSAFSIDLDSGAAIKNPPTDENAYLKIKAEAKGRPDEKLEVYVNGKLAGLVVGGFWVTELPIGRYLVLVRASGDLFVHQRFDITLTAEGAQIPEKGSLQLLPRFATILFEGKPANATISVNGEVRRTQNGALREELKPGEYAILVEAPGYVPAPRRIVRLSAGDELPFRYDLERNAGSLALAGGPHGAEVLVDGKAAGRLPLTLDDLDVGDHVVDVQALGHRPERRLARVRLGETTRLDIQLSSKRARLKVEAMAGVDGAKAPVEADVYLDGSLVGRTPWKGETLAEVPVELELRLGRRKSGAQRLVLQEGQEARQVIAVPGTWAGATGTLRFELSPGPWTIRSGAAELSQSETNALHPGKLELQFYLGDKPVGRGIVDVAPDEQRIVRVLERPKLPEELDRSRTWWSARKWTSSTLAVVATCAGGAALLIAHDAAGNRDAAYRALEVASVSAEVDGYRTAVVDEEHRRSTAQVVSTSLLTAGLVFAGWTAYEWLLGEPSGGQFVATGLDEGERAR